MAFFNLIACHKPLHALNYEFTEAPNIARDGQGYYATHDST
jgi:hypothetical protein